VLKALGFEHNTDKKHWFFTGGSAKGMQEKFNILDKAVDKLE